MGQAKKKTSIRVPLEIVSEDQIGPHKDSYCYLMNNDIKQGPYLTSEVEELIMNEPHLTAHFVIVDMEENNPPPAPQVNTDSTSTMGNIHSLTNDVYLLVEGQKNGPFTMQELTQKLDNKDILYTDYISLNGGSDWLKISEHDSFNRRSANRDEHLPSMPQENLFKSQRKKVKKEDKENDALIGLAYIGKNGDKIPQKIIAKSEAHVDKKLSLINWGKLLKFIALVGAFLGLIFVAKFTYENRTEKDSKTTKKAKATPVQKKAKKKTAKKIAKKRAKTKARVTPKRTISNAQKAKNRVRNSHRSVNSKKSFKSSTPYKANKKIQARRKIEESRNERYDEQDGYLQTDPIELDPIEEGLEDDIINPTGDDIEDLIVDEEFINEINDAVEEELFEEELDF